MNNFWHSLTKPIFALAPMQDVTDVVFREILSEIAPPDVYFTEFTNTRSLFSDGHDNAIKSLKYSENQRPIVAQIWGNIPEYFHKAAQLVQELGFDGLDINTGCPDRDVIRGGSGSALIKEPTLVKELIIASREGAPDIPVSVKTRLGFDKIVTEDWMGFLLEQKLPVITVHGRIAKNMSKFPARWGEIAKAVELRNQISTDTLIIGNGDVISYQDGLDKIAVSGVDGVMIGRGVFSNPWVFEKHSPEIEHTTKEHLEVLKRHTKLFVDTWGDTKNFAIMKKFFKIYIRGFNGARPFRDKIMQIKTYPEFEEVLSELLL